MNRFNELFCLLQDAPTQQDDRDVVIQAIKNWGPALMHASDEIKNDKIFVLLAISMPGRAFLHLEKKFYDDKEVLIKAMNNDVLSLFYASESLQHDFELLSMLKNHQTRFSNTEPHKSWYTNRMQTLSILEDEQWMISHIPTSSKPNTLRKF